MGSFVLHGNIIDSESPERLRVAADSYLVCEPFVFKLAVLVNRDENLPKFW